MGRQSEELADASGVEPAVADARARLDLDSALTPPEWSLRLPVPSQVEFWQAEEGRQHRRLRYLHDDGSWRIRRLRP
jgi:pyridoxamine 5'-phosphate oxidase